MVNSSLPSLTTANRSREESVSFLNLSSKRNHFKGNDSDQKLILKGAIISGFYFFTCVAVCEHVCMMSVCVREYMHVCDHVCLACGETEYNACSVSSL